MEVIRPDRHFTYTDYCGWDDGKRYELVSGMAFLMEPAPLWPHQDIQMHLSNQIYNHLKGKAGKVFTAPFDVRLNADAGDDTVLQPDVVVFRDRHKLYGTGCIGAPDMVIEIMSQSTEHLDKLVKFNQYLQAGVREYWIVDPDATTVQVCLLNNGGYDIKVYTGEDDVPVHTLGGCMIKLAEVFVQ